MIGHALHAKHTISPLESNASSAKQPNNQGLVNTEKGTLAVSVAVIVETAVSPWNLEIGDVVPVTHITLLRAHNVTDAVQINQRAHKLHRWSLVTGHARSAAIWTLHGVLRAIVVDLPSRELHCTSYVSINSRGLLLYYVGIGKSLGVINLSVITWHSRYLSRLACTPKKKTIHWKFLL